MSKVTYVTASSIAALALLSAASLYRVLHQVERSSAGIPVHLTASECFLQSLRKLALLLRHPLRFLTQQGDLL